MKWVIPSRLSATTRTADLFERLRRHRPENTDPTKRFPTSPEVPRHAALCASLESFVPAHTAASKFPTFPTAPPPSRAVYHTWEACVLPLNYTRDSLVEVAGSVLLLLRCGQIAGGIGGIMSALFMPPRP